MAGSCQDEHYELPRPTINRNRRRSPTPHENNISSTRELNFHDSAQSQRHCPVADEDECYRGRGSDDEDINNPNELLSEALLAVASAEEYAAKIIKLQQACLTPLKEDLADWLNKIMNVSSITSENFMQKLDNGVIICRLAKVIANWCEQQHQQQLQHPDNVGQQSGNPRQQQHKKIVTSQAHNRTASLLRLDSANTNHLYSQQNYSPKLSTSTQSVHHTAITNGDAIRWEQTKIWEDAKCRTFYARDNVSNFIKWSKEFGVNQSVLFESDDLVLHANARQVVLCLLDVARIAYVRYGFTEAPGLVKFEQEIDRESDVEKENAAISASGGTFCGSHGQNTDHKGLDQSDSSGDKKNGSKVVGARTNGNHVYLPRKSRGSLAADPTDDLIMRYCLHKEETARKKAAELEAASLEARTETNHPDNDGNTTSQKSINKTEECSSTMLTSEANVKPDHKVQPRTNQRIDDDQIPVSSETRDAHRDFVCKSPNGDLASLNKNNLSLDNRVDSLDSGEGRTESASTSHSRTPVDSSQNHVSSTTTYSSSMKRTDSIASIDSDPSSAMETSDLSSSRSSLFSHRGANSSNTSKREKESDLDGKVMRIAKSYYGKSAKKGVTRLSEGKYQIADRIVFVRLLKGHRVMVRIGGGWDTLENFLFRHKSDPSQVIDVDNLLPLETKLTFDKSPQLTPTHNKTPYRRSNTNLSTSNLSISNYAHRQHISSLATPTKSNIATSIPNAFSTPQHTKRSDSQIINHRQAPQTVGTTTGKQVPYFLIHSNQVGNKQLDHHQQGDSLVSSSPMNSYQTAFRKLSIDEQQQRLSGANPTLTATSRYKNRSLGNSRIPTASVTNLYPATLTTRVNPSNLKVTKQTSTTNLSSNGRQFNKRESSMGRTLVKTNNKQVH